MNNEETIKEINQHLSESLEGWSEILLEADYNGLSAYLYFNEDDLLNILQIFTSIWSNNAIKRGILTEDNVTQKMKLFKDTINDVFGVDTITLAEVESVLDNNNCELN